MDKETMLVQLTDLINGLAVDQDIARMEAGQQAHMRYLGIKNTRKSLIQARNDLKALIAMLEAQASEGGQ